MVLEEKSSFRQKIKGQSLKAGIRRSAVSSVCRTRLTDTDQDLNAWRGKWCWEEGLDVFGNGELSGQA